MPAVHVGTPEDTSSYHIEEVDGIKVHISPSIGMKDGFKIITSGFMFFKGLALAPLD